MFSIFDGRGWPLRSDYESVIKKTEQQSRTISDLEYKEKELNTLLSKKQSCHHKEFEQTFQEMQTEIKILQDMTQQSENELMQWHHLIIIIQTVVIPVQSSIIFVAVEQEGINHKFQSKFIGVYVVIWKDTPRDILQHQQ